MSDNEPFDWGRALVHGILGGLLGGVVGIIVWWGLLSGSPKGWLAIPVLAGVCGLLGAIKGDDFWENLQHYDWLNPSNWL